MLAYQTEEMEGVEMSWCSALVQALNRGIRVTLPLSIASGAVLFICPVRTWLHIDQMNEVRLVLAFVFLATTVSWILGLLAWIFRLGARVQTKDPTRDVLGRLSADEKAVLREHVESGRKSMIHSLGNGAAFGLVHKGIMYQPSPFGRPGSISMNITDEAWDYLQKHPSLLD